MSGCPFDQESQDWSGYIINFGNGQEKHGKTWKKVRKILNIVHGQEKHKD